MSMVVVGGVGGRCCVDSVGDTASSGVGLDGVALNCLGLGCAGVGNMALGGLGI